MKKKSAKKVDRVPPQEVLPAGVKEADLKRRPWKEETALGYQQIQEMGLEDNLLQFYFTERFGWVLRTLHISSPSRRQKARGATTDRTYGITVSGKELVTVGKGPHVLRELTLYLDQRNLDHLRPLVDLYVEGMKKAGECRDVRSSRQARGTVHRRGFGSSGFFGGGAWDS